MKARITENIGLLNKRLFSAQDLSNYLSVGICTARRIGKESGASVHIGKRVLYDKQTIDRYVDDLPVTS